MEVPTLYKRHDTVVFCLTKIPGETWRTYPVTPMQQSRVTSHKIAEDTSFMGYLCSTRFPVLEFNLSMFHLYVQCQKKLNNMNLLKGSEVISACYYMKQSCTNWTASKHNTHTRILKKHDTWNQAYSLIQYRQPDGDSCLKNQSPWM